MKKTIRIVALFTAFLTVISLTACGKKIEKTLFYGNTDLSKYVKLSDYKSLSVDTASDEYKSAYEDEIKSDAEANDLYVEKHEGKVAEGDIANIDYVGKKDGVAFEGGTAEGYDLTIGSHSFIDGFEDGLIGVNIGDTVDLNLTFPEGYQSEELAGKAVVFTVKVNYVKTPASSDIDSIYSKLGFDSAEDYKADLRERAIKNMLYNSVVSDSEIDGYPKGQEDTFLDALYEFYDSYYTENYNVTFKEVLESNNMTVDDYKEQMKQGIETELESNMIYYAILQKEGLKTDYELKDEEKTNQEILDEITKVGHVVKDFLYKNAKIK